ncbi:cytochrome c oxidase subunit 7A-related protein, mitochondrial-like [Argonauta hians]
MFYKFNSLRGRISPSSQGAAYVPQGINKFKEFDSQLTFESKSVLTTRSAADPLIDPAYTGPTLGLVPKTPTYKSVMDLQKHFLKNDGLLVWQKLGMRDRSMYLMSMGLVVTGLLLLGNTLVTMSFPRKSE